MHAHHEPVLVDESLRHLAPERGGLFVDCTFGLGGHAEALLEAHEGVRLLGIDRDPAALALGAERLERFGDRVRLVEGDFAAVADHLERHGAGFVPGAPDDGPVRAAGIFADLGLSSLQLDTPERGFSFRFDAPLDMRMGRGGPTAADIVNTYPEDDLARIFKAYGEERQSRRIARVLAEAREEEPVETTGELRRLVLAAKGGRSWREGRVDPATRVFQALRIEVNRELEALESFLDHAAELLDEDGRLVVISYHSLEDRRVKNTLRDLARGEVDRVTGRPRPETRILEVLTKKPLRPSEAEEEDNPRSRSARLRAARRRTRGEIQSDIRTDGGDRGVGEP